MAEKHTGVWSRVRLELARSHNHPEGSTRHGYILVLPLDTNGRLDEPLYRQSPQISTIHRFWEGEGDDTGQIVHRGAHRWAFAYHGDRGNDEPVPHLSDHVFRVGEYLAVRESSGREHVLRIASIEPARGLA